MGGNNFYKAIWDDKRPTLHSSVPSRMWSEALVRLIETEEEEQKGHDVHSNDYITLSKLFLCLPMP